MKSEIFNDLYLFHLHTDFTDGHITVPAYFEFAVRHNVQRLIFLEHIREVPSYSIHDFVALVSREAGKHGIAYNIGFESKILPDGTLDITDEQIEIADVIGIAEHGSFQDESRLEDSLYKVFDLYRDYTATKHVIWVHPGLSFKMRGIFPETGTWYNKVLQYAIANGIRIERNLRHGLVSQKMSDHLGDFVVVGADAHSFTDLANWCKFMSNEEDIKDARYKVER